MNAMSTLREANLSAATSKVGAYLDSLKPEAFAFLTPDMLLEFCQMKLRGIDEQVQRAFKGQTKRNDVSTALSELANTVGTHKNFSGTGEAARLVAEYNKVIDQVGAESKLGQQLVQDRDAILRSAGDGPDNGDSAEVNSDDFQKLTANLSRMQGDVNREGELEMIQLQSLMSQRQQALQMCTNMVSSLGQSATSIAQNVGK